MDDAQMLRGLLKRRVPVVIVVVLALLLPGAYGIYRWTNRVQVDTGQVSGAATTELEINDQNALVVADRRDGPRPVALMLHGVALDERVSIERKALPFTQALVDAGWVVASSTAGGDAWGSVESQQDYLDLLSWIREHYQVSGVVLVSLSMGGVAGLQLASQGQVDGLLGWVGISPVTNLPAMADDPRLTESIDEALTDEQEEELNPLELEPATLAAVPLVLMTSRTDDVTPADEQVRPFTARFPGARVVECEGGHVAEDCYRADEVLRLAA